MNWRTFAKRLAEKGKIWITLFSDSAVRFGTS